MRAARITATAASVCALIVATGCGGGAENDYAEAYTAVTKKIERQLGTLQSAPTADPARLRSQLRTMSVALGQAVTELTAIEPPDNAKPGHVQVQTGVKILAADMRRSADELADTSSPTATVDALQTITNSKGPTDIQAGEQQLRQAGYEVQ